MRQPCSQGVQSQLRLPRAARANHQRQRSRSGGRPRLCPEALPRPTLKVAVSWLLRRRCGFIRALRSDRRARRASCPLIAAVSLDEGPIAIHRTFLAQDLRSKAAFTKPKRTLGTLGAAAVRLFAPINGQLGLAEGIESAMAAYALTGVPTWATLGNERFGLVAIPESVTDLHLFVDHDDGGNLARERGVAAYAAEGRIIRVRKPSAVGSDWNDELQDWLRRKAAQ
jgi:carbonic anhydrase